VLKSSRHGQQNGDRVFPFLGQSMTTIKKRGKREDNDDEGVTCDGDKEERSRTMWVAFGKPGEEDADTIKSCEAHHTKCGVFRAFGKELKRVDDNFVSGITGAVFSSGLAGAAE
jgi:hypothetical protein